MVYGDIGDHGRYPIEIMIDHVKIRSTLPHWLDTAEPASDAAINRLVKTTGFSLPADYLGLLRLTDGGETFLGDDDSEDGSYIVLWPSSEVLVLNAEHELPVYASHYFAIGTNGGGELFAFDMTRSDDAVFMLPTIGLSNDAGILYCDTFAALLALLPQHGG
ncbi:MAG: hypothetical protein DWH99_08710 [Planctomycetota bacterium]|jgi:hypothetical protein|nr:MAG: hypothetical protein DWH99_08710 [Planctomycetota bacterium]